MAPRPHDAERSPALQSDRNGGHTQQTGEQDFVGDADEVGDGDEEAPVLSASLQRFSRLGGHRAAENSGDNDAEEVDDDEEDAEYGGDQDWGRHAVADASPTAAGPASPACTVSEDSLDGSPAGGGDRPATPDAQAGPSSAAASPARPSARAAHGADRPLRTPDRSPLRSPPRPSGGTAGRRRWGVPAPSARDGPTVQPASPAAEGGRARRRRHSGTPSLPAAQGPLSQAQPPAQGVPEQPAAPTAFVRGPNARTISLQWPPPPSAGAPVLAYRVQCRVATERDAERGTSFCRRCRALQAGRGHRLTPPHSLPISHD